MKELFFEGGVFCMTVLTVLLIGLLLAAWKAPAWVKEIGILAPIFALIWAMLGFMNAADALQQAGDISPALMMGGYKAMSIQIAYGLLIFFVSRIIRILQKPRM